MTTKLLQKKLFVQRSPIHGYGVFAEESINQGEIVEECYGLLATETGVNLRDYWFQGTKDNESILLTGFGSIYNHSDDPSATYVFDTDRQCMVITATRFIAPQEEIFVSYGESWFSSRNFSKKQRSLSRRMLHITTLPVWRGLLACFSMLFMVHLLKVILT